MVEVTISLTTIDDSGPEPVLIARCWHVPAEIIDGLDARLTLLYGQPDEMIANAETMARNGQRAAEEDGAVYLMAGETDG